MTKHIFEMISKLVPKQFLPSAHRLECNVQTKETRRIELTIEEKRGRLENKLQHNKEKFINNYFSIRNILSWIKVKKLKRKKRIYHELIGKITITHAGIEQNLKATLVCDWGVPEKIKTPKAKRKKKIEHIFGRELLGTFIQQLEEAKCPKKWRFAYSEVLDNFSTLSKKRNEVLKALYGHNENTQEIIQINQLVHNNMLQIMRANDNDFEVFLKQWIKPIYESDLRSLLHDLEKIAHRLQQLRSEVFIEKHNLYQKIFGMPQIPEDAYKNPYKYIKISNN